MFPFHPISTLFPYTTLFRSYFKISPPSPSSSVYAYRRVMVYATIIDYSGYRIRQPVIRYPHNFTQVDRKSTRLNSSHTVRSYAVFCLKKNLRLEGGGHAVPS